MSDRYVLVVSLWIHKGQEMAFETYEREAAWIMARHKGRIDSAVRMAAPEGMGDRAGHPYEVHVVSFPDKAAYGSYGADPATLALRQKRSQIISRTTLMSGREAGPY